MSQVFNVYCDESCHLENDRQKVMVVGAIWCPVEKTRETALRLREIKQKHDLARDFEVKWTKVSPAKQALYMDLLDYFFDDDDLHFRALIVTNKNELRHDRFEQDHDTFYYKMYFHMLRVLLIPHASYRIYLDIKDTKSSQKVQKLHEVLCNNMLDFDRQIISSLQTVRSHEVEQIQLCDLLIGAISYVNRGLEANEAKHALVERMKERSGYSLVRSTLLREKKVNILRWEPQEDLI